jgi:hypothetical protein
MLGTSGAENKLIIVSATLVMVISWSFGMARDFQLTGDKVEHGGLIFR